jgi:hypothetical protein
MRVFLAVMLIPVSFFLGSLFTMWISDLIVGPFGLHGYTYSQAMGITAVVEVSILASMIIGLIYSALFD